MKTSLPKALILGHQRTDQFEVTSSIYSEEVLQEAVIVRPTTEADFLHDFCTFKPDLVITIGNSREAFPVINRLAKDFYISTKWCHYYQQPEDEVLANDIATWTVEWICDSTSRVFNDPATPFFSVFTPAYKTGDRLLRTYESVKNQTYPNWEWVVIDDSPIDHEETWNQLQQLAAKDYRVKPYRLFPVTGGNIGEAKNRACSLSRGSWLIELDHDDYLMPTLMETSAKAIRQFPDAGFLYTDVAEPYEDGQMRTYTPIIGTRDEWYANPKNTFVWGYGGHEEVEWNGKTYVSHVYPEINPKTIRFNIGMPNHARIWKREVYQQMGGHNRFMSVTDDYELIVRTFLNTRMVHIKQMLYLQYNNRNSTVDNNVTDINRRARLIRDHYDRQIHDRIIELGGTDWDWDEQLQGGSKLQNDCSRLKYFEEESYLNYIYE